MKVSTLDSGLFKLDGGAMFGVVPRQLWQRLNPPDNNNMCTWAMRCLLIQTGDKNIVVDTGLGDKQDEKFRSHFEPHGDTSLISSIALHGLKPDDITDVFITHLHFDHVGGAVKRNGNDQLVPAFSNATYWTNKSHFDWAMHPNAREAASFLKENFVPLYDAGVLKFIEEQKVTQWLPGIYVYFFHGHTESMMGLLIDTGSSKVFYPADLIPSSGHIGLPYIMSYDVRPLDTLREKNTMLEQAAAEQWIICFEHDPVTEAAIVEKNEKGRIVISRHGSLESLMEKQIS